MDYATWAGSTVGFPAALTLFEMMDPINGRTYIKPSNSALRVCGLLGFVSGFILVYNRSSKRFWGHAENAREVKMDRFQVKKNLSEGKPPFGSKPSMPENLQDVAMRNSKNSQHALFFFPWFSFFTHEYHGIDLKKYYETRAGEEQWGFKLPPYESLEKTTV
ncbi:hypothetical protein BON22_1678 [Cyberlindnera fabianii]|nr:hypothetical protein BON22_1678 [Cyberlindnera fabianii]